MPRKPRVSLPGVPEYIIQRGNNRQVIFASNGDIKAHVTWLGDYARQFDVAIHAWVLMSNHVHLLCTPTGSATTSSQMMQSVGRLLHEEKLGRRIGWRKNKD
ncbi:transposase [Aliiglaciecola sp. CAU 1673]|uniref:transposase n=1 Tax=Aliiglaciecola sp. CAU 1673 TaxID=3032595 RepID=UPI0023DA762D|nr:transposase [Aliiglaciecola sp. CAU 1673]MDF2176848.1 transposase [Aliiglaciecola sp. CAU 1673]